MFGDGGRDRTDEVLSDTCRFCRPEPYQLGYTVSNLAEETGVEPASPFGRRFSKPLSYQLDALLRIRFKLGG